MQFVRTLQIHKKSVYDPATFIEVVPIKKRNTVVSIQDLKW